MGSAIEVRGLEKSYGSFRAVKGIDLDVDEGEIVAFLGPNGAGKTTTIEVLEGFRTATAGSVTVLGHDPANAPLSWREQIGIVLQESEPIPELTVLESICLQAGYYQDSRNPEEVMELVGLRDSANHRTRKLSGGQRRRLDLALALVGDPKLVFLDEPTTGFDPAARRESWAMIEALRDLGNTVLLTTHYMDEAEQLADRIVVISDGLIVAKGSAKDLAESVGAMTQIVWNATPEDLPPEELLATVNPETHRYHIESNNVVSDLHTLTSWAVANSIELNNLNVSRPTLEDVYLKLIANTAAAETQQ